MGIVIKYKGSKLVIKNGFRFSIQKDEYSNEVINCKITNYHKVFHDYSTNGKQYDVVDVDSGRTLLKNEKYSYINDSSMLFYSAEKIFKNLKNKNVKVKSYER